MESDVVATLRQAVDRLAALEPATLGDDELAALVVELSRAEGRMAGVQARLLGAFDARRLWRKAGYRSASAWLAHQGALSLRRARTVLRRARTAHTLAATSTALRDGTLSLDAASAILRAHRPVTAAALARDEQMLVDQARTLEVVDVERMMRYWEQHADQEGVEHRAAERHQHRRVACTEGIDGWWLDGWLPGVEGAIVQGELTRLEQQLFRADWSAAVAEHGTSATSERLGRTPAQRRADALVEMARRSATAPVDGRRPAPLVTVLVGYETFAGRVCQLASGPVLTPGQVAALLDHAVIERVVFDGPSRVIDVGHQRLFTGAVRRAIQVRDRTCVHPGCHEPAERCDIDHLQPHAHQGPTIQHNGVLRCPFHHRQRHHQAPLARPP